MDKKYLICCSGGIGRLVEKKSEFIARICPARTEEEAEAFLEQVRKQYWDARHHCYAYITDDGKKMSDDGEPSQTAGKPMMDLLENAGVHRCVAVVTRYFGGTLLGTGGLVRAYQGALKEALTQCELSERIEGILLAYRIDYDLFGKIQRLAESNALYVYETEFTDTVHLKIAVDKSSAENIINKVEELSAGKAVLLSKDDAFYIIKDNKVRFI